MMAKVMVPCGHCQGCGQVELTGDHLLTLQILMEQAGEVSGADMARIIGSVTNEAMCNRLVILERYGLATSRRWGPKRLYKAVKRTSEVD